jgi:hypothetical protein
VHANAAVPEYAPFKVKPQPKHRALLPMSLQVALPTASSHSIPHLFSGTSAKWVTVLAELHFLS